MADKNSTDQDQGMGGQGGGGQGGGGQGQGRGGPGVNGQDSGEANGRRRRSHQGELGGRLQVVDLSGPDALEAGGLQGGAQGRQEANGGARPREHDRSEGALIEHVVRAADGPAAAVAARVEAVVVEAKDVNKR